jgi:tRNA-specific 2-thiouridylase
MLGFQEHVEAPVGRGRHPRHGFAGAAGGAACGDLVRLSVALAGGRVTDAGFDARGCAATAAAGSAAVALVRGRALLDAARIGPGELEAELGGLSPAKRHGAELAADALHRSLGAAARAVEPLAAHPTRTLVAMSGGVDSAVAALLTSGQGEEAVGVTLELWADPHNDGERSCCSAQAVRGARALAHRMGMAHLTLDLRAEFRAGVVEPFMADHGAGLTPNPCVRCNGHVRLDAMLELAERLGADALATGHYARTVAVDEGVLLSPAHDAAKDQSYMLAAVSPATLARLRFPLGALTKPEVRALAAEGGLPVAAKPDSQDLCFLAGTDRAAFLARHSGMSERMGDIVDRRGRVLGRHRGHHGFTVGQRKGLGLSSPEPLYVLETDAAANRVVVGSRTSLRRSRVPIRGATLHRDGAAVDRVKLRYRSKPLAARLAGPPAAGRHARLELCLTEPVEGAAPGQTACLMSGDVIVGHATIAASR